MSKMMNHAIQDRLTNWWSHGEQERPCILLYCPRDTAEDVSGCGSLDSYWLDPAGQESRAVKSILSRRYFGEALPYHYVDFGASTLCGMQGCTMRYNSTQTMWAEPQFSTLSEALDAAIDHTLPFTRCVRETFQRIMGRLGGHALIGPYCIGSPADNLAALIGTDNFLYALYDEPDLLEQALKRQLELWMEEFDYICSAMGPSAAAPITSWHGILARGSTFAIQEDIGYMLGTEHYNRFLLPGIQAMAERMEYSFFHLDGIGAVKHLDALLRIQSLKVVQWQPGEGHMEVSQWIDVIRKILRAGKSCQLYVQPEEVEPLIRAVGARGMLLIVYTGEEQALRLAERYRLEENVIDGEEFL